MKDENSNKHTFIKFLIIGVIILIAIVLYSRFITTNGLEVKEYSISNSNIEDNFYGLKLVHISDIHYGQTTNDKYLSKLVKEINLLKPDIVVMTGDMFDKEKSINDDDITTITTELSKINASIDKFIISGDNDTHFNNWEKVVTECGFKILDNKYELIYSGGYTPILIAGIGSVDSNNINENYIKTEEFINSSNELNNIYKILLIHQPDLIENINYSYFNLILAGHSLGGQIKLPIINDWLLPNNAIKYHEKYYKLNNTDLYVSNGIGTTSFKFRLFNKPSINLYRFINK